MGSVRSAWAVVYRYFAESKPLILHWNGSAWSSFTPGDPLSNDDSLWAVASLSNGAAVAAGETLDGKFDSEPRAHVQKTGSLIAADLDCDGSVGFSDLVMLLAQWGPCEFCVADINADGIVGFGDMLMLLSTWD